MFSLQSVIRCAPLALALSATVAVAQAPTTGTLAPASTASVSTDPSDRLAANLVILSRRPRDVNALIGAGLSAIAIGDGNAALGFLARAEEIAPTNGYIKSALGSALLLVERPAEALKLFAEASSLGVADSHFARDRGLAYDLRGESKLAQRDYAAALRYGEDDEVTRRLALSLGISGESSKGLSLLDPLLIKKDQAAWRARAFILAMNGDWRGAEKIALQVMPGGGSDVMSPFLRRLASLSPAERAHAVNFGTMPSDGQRYASVGLNDNFRPVGGGQGDGLIPAGPPLGASVPTPIADAPVVTPIVTKAPRRRPGRDGVAVAALPNAQVGSLPVAQQPLVKTPSVSTTTRIGQRIGAVPPRPTVGEPAQVAVRTTMTALPLPDNVRPPVKTAVASVATTAPVTTVATSAAPKPAASPPPIFEVPPAQVALAAPVQATQAQPKPVQATTVPIPATGFDAVQTPKVETPKVEMTVAAPVQTAMVVSPQLAPAPPTVALPSVPTQTAIAAPAVATPPSAAIVAPSPAPPPAQIVAALPPVAAPAGALIGPPAPTGVVTPAQPLPAPSATPADVVEAPTPAQLVASQPAPVSSGLGSIIATIETEAETAMALPTAAELRSIRLAAQRKAAAAARAADKLEADALAEKERLAAEKAKRELEKAEAAKNPARIWVQVAGGANKAGLPSTFKRMREANAELFKGLVAWSTPLNRTNRLLVGPFKSMSTARDLVNKMGKAGLSVFAYTSSLGQEIEKLAVR